MRFDHKCPIIANKNDSHLQKDQIMQRFSSADIQRDATASSSDTWANTVVRINSEDLFRQGREVEIAHGGRIYRLRVTQLNKLILTA